MSFPPNDQPTICNKLTIHHGSLFEFQPLLFGLSNEAKSLHIDTIPVSQSICNLTKSMNLADCPNSKSKSKIQIHTSPFIWPCILKACSKLFDSSLGHIQTQYGTYFTSHRKETKNSEVFRKLSLHLMRSKSTLWQT